MPNLPRLLLVGASVRAAAFSALRAGFAPWCADLFADVDLCAVAPCRRVPGSAYPDGLLDTLADAPHATLMYVGALENRPALVARLAERFVLWGNDAQVLRRARCPEIVKEILDRHDLPAPEIRWPPPRRAARGQRWLIKPRRGASGSGIRALPDSGTSSLPRGCYLQEWIAGTSCAAVFVGQPGGACLLLGVTRQLIGESWLHARPFQYCGSIGPLRLSDMQERNVNDVGAALARALGLRGLFGVDGVLRDDEFWPVEVNPRYTASVEVLEHALTVPALKLHAAAFDEASQLPPLETANSQSGERVIGKAILFADRPMRFPGGVRWQVPSDPWSLPRHADIPRPGEPVQPGQPLMTFFAGGQDEAECAESLSRAVSSCA